MASAYNWSSLASSSKAAQVVVTKWKSVNVMLCNSVQVIFPSLFVSVAVNREAKMPLRMTNYFTTMTKNLN